MKHRLALAFAFTAAIGFSQALEVTVNGGASRLGNTLAGQLTGSDVKFDDGFRLGFLMTLNNWRFFSNEVGYAYSRTAFVLPDQKAGTAIHTGLYNILANALPEGSKIRPFVGGGGHFSNFAWPGYSALQGGGQMKFGVNYGAGIKVRVGEIFIIRVDGRQFITPKPFKDILGGDGMLRQNAFTVGFGIGI